jgi:hypothetical protein
MTDLRFNKAFNDQCRDLSTQIAKLYDDVEDPTVVMAALIPCISQTIMNVAYAMQIPMNTVIDPLVEDIKDCTARMFVFFESAKTEGGVQ